MGDKISIKGSEFKEVIEEVVEGYGGVYELDEKNIKKVVKEEQDKFRKTLKSGLKQFEKISSKGNISGADAFKLFSTNGFPIELTLDLAEEKGIDVDVDEYKVELSKHQDSSRSAAVGKFKGGLAGDSEMEIKYHTTTHLLNTALKRVLGDDVQQKGSNINPDRLRFDFSWGEKLTDEQKKEVENIINEKISNGLEVVKEEMSYDDAKKSGATGIFEDKYGDVVSVYSIKEKDGSVFSMEMCGGPHVSNISELGKFRIKKEGSSSAGVRRIKAVLE